MVLLQWYFIHNICSFGRQQANRCQQMSCSTCAERYSVKRRFIFPHISIRVLLYFNHVLLTRITGHKSLTYFSLCTIDAFRQMPFGLSVKRNCTTISFISQLFLRKEKIIKKYIKETVRKGFHMKET